MKQDVLRLDITMDDIAVMHELNSMADLSDHTPYFFLRKTALFLQGRINVAPTAWFENEIKVVFVAEESIELDNVGVIKITLYFDLTH